MRDKNDVVMVELDRPRELRFGYKALKKMTKLFNTNMSEFSLESFDIEDMDKIYYIGLLSDDKDLKQEDVEDLLDQAPSIQYLMDKLSEALSSTFGADLTIEEVKENPEAVAEKNS